MPSEPTIKGGWVQISARARAICRDHWNPERTRCKGCPIRLPCEQRVAPLTRENVNAHVAGVNAAAEDVGR